MPSLHFTNGDHAAARLRAAELPGDVVPWRDVLHDGPVPPDEDERGFRETRAEFLASRGWTSVTAATAMLTARDAQLAAVSGTDEVVLWFEPDLFDQLQLVQLLARLARRPMLARPAITIVPADCFLGEVLPNRASMLHTARRTLTRRDLDQGHSAWGAFTASTPDALAAMADRLDEEVVARTYSDDTMVRLPHLAAALRRLLEEYPGEEDGLSRTERQLCEVLTTGSTTPEHLFEGCQLAESWRWLGDRSFAWYLERLSSGAEPLVTRPNGTRIIAPLPDTDGRAFWEQRVQLTPFGARVLAGRADAVAANGLDRWIGAVHCTMERHWRWDPHRGRVVPWCGGRRAAVGD